MERQGRRQEAWRDREGGKGHGETGEEARDMETQGRRQETWGDRQGGILLFFTS